MKKLILTIAVGLACESAFAQGTLNFANAAAGVNAPVVGASGNQYQADLYYGPLGTTDSSLLTGLGQPSFFNAGAQSGYFTCGARTIPGIPGGTSIVVQVRAWYVQDPTFSGESRLFNITLATPPATPVNLVGMQSFSIFIPEPTSIALWALGAAALMSFRRRK